jgi:8-oxo-dGTP diphosphatase
LSRPEYKFCPRCGGPLELRQVKSGEPERLVCQQCSFIFYLGPKLVAAVIFEVDGGIVMTQRAIEPGYGKWTFPGGFMDQGETAKAAASREAREEAGVEVEVGEILGLYSYEGQVPVIAVYKGRITGGKLEPLDETLAVEIFPHDRLPWSEMAFPSTEHALKDYVRSVS